MTDYSARSAAIRAARKALGADRMVGVHFTVSEAEGRFAWAPINLATGEVEVPAASAKKPATPQVAPLAGMAPLGIVPPKGKSPADEGIAAAKADDAARERATRMSGKFKAALEAAKAGKLPPEPDFTAETHKRWRPKLAEVVALAAKGDLAGLKAYEIKPVSTSPKAIDRYRNLAVVALEARA